MALTAGVAKDRYNKDLFNALMRGEEDKVIQLCRENPEGPFHVLTIHQDTVLHVATYSKQKDLVLSLLQELPEGQFAKLMHPNDAGNTVLHEAVTSEKTVNVAMELLLKAPKLLSIRNQHGETALFRAARYGKSKMYEFLDNEMNKSFKDPAELKPFHYRDDKTTILHLSILNEQFALLIASKYEYLLNEKDDDGMTALQLLACNLAAFEDRRSTPLSLKRFFYSSQRCCTVPFWESIQKQHRIYEEAVKLAKFLIQRDTSWEETESALDPIKPKIHKYSAKNSQDRGVGKGKKAATSVDQTVHQKFAETPLLLATKSGIMEIVEEILTTYPQAVDHVDHNGQNVLHRAIKYRQMQVFDFVEKMEIPMRRLTRKIDNNENSILHYVGKRSQDREAEDMRSPALILQENLLLFERVEKICKRYSVKHFNSKGQTAAELFREANAKPRTDAKEWLKRTAENCSIVAVLIATVAFAAAYTIPGGPNQTTGYPLLLNQPFFVIFTIADVLSLTLALTSVIVFLSILTSSFQLMDFKQSLPQKLMLGVTLLICSVSFMMVAFAATVILMIHNNEHWTKVALYLVALLPVCIFALSYLPLYVSLIKTSIFSLKNIGEALPRCNSVFPRSSITTQVEFQKSQASIPSNPSQSQGSSSTSHYLEIE